MTARPSETVKPWRANSCLPWYSSRSIAAAEASGAGASGDGWWLTGRRAAVTLDGCPVSFRERWWPPRWRSRWAAAWRRGRGRQRAGHHRERRAGPADHWATSLTLTATRHEQRPERTGTPATSSSTSSATRSRTRRSSRDRAAWTSSRCRARSSADLAPGGSRQVQVTSSLPALGPYAIDVGASTRRPGRRGRTRSSTSPLIRCETTVEAKADIKLNLSASAESVANGAPVTIRGLVTNTKAAGTAYGAQVKFSVPPGVEVVSRPARLHRQRAQPRLPGRRSRPAGHRRARARPAVDHRGRVHRPGHRDLGAPGHDARRHPGPGHRQRPAAARHDARHADADADARGPADAATVSAADPRPRPAGGRALRALAPARRSSCAPAGRGTRPRHDPRHGPQARAACSRAPARSAPFTLTLPRRGKVTVSLDVTLDNGRRYKATRSFRRC